MKIDDCIKCKHHMDHVADQVLCRFWGETEHRVIERGIKDGIVYVRLCPLEMKKK